MSVLERAVLKHLPTEARILICDIERRPGEALVWSPKVDYVSPDMMLVKPSTISFAAKWYGQAKVMFASDHHDGHAEMLAQVWALLNEAHVVVGYNSIRFDVPALNAEFAQAGMPPPSPFKDIDLLRVAKNRFMLPYNRLDEVCKDMGIGKKVAHSGIALWKGCIAGDEAAWKLMRTYNKHDVVLTEELYCRLRPWIKNHPNVNMFREERISGCHACGSEDVEEAGFSYAATRAYRQFWCNTCWSYSQATHHEPTMAQHRKGAT